jgi:hypothetical protein
MKCGLLSVSRIPHWASKTQTATETRAAEEEVTWGGNELEGHFSSLFATQGVRGAIGASSGK